MGVTNGLNVSDPRFSAKYGNPYLNNFAGSGSKPYATLNARGAHSPIHGARKNNYAGTMLGNGSLGRNGKSPKSQGHHHYIVSQEGEMKNNAALATHV